jgi:hypothetical protein
MPSIVSEGHHIENVDLTNAIITAPLIQSGQFRLSEFDERRQPFHSRASDHPSQAERVARQAEVLANPEFDSFVSPALTSLRKLTNTIRRALYEPPTDLQHSNAAG